MMRQLIGRRSEPWPCGARITISPSMWSRQRRWLWTRGKGGLNTHLFSSTGLQWSRLRAPWCPHHQQTITVQTHQDSWEEGKAKPIPPKETEKIWHGSSDPQKDRQLHHWEHPDCLHHCWLWNCSASDSKALQRIVHMAQYITGAKLPAIQDLYTRQCQRKAL
jgi:hypothetical protein